jgi:serine/threonine-protein kinase HipA
LIHQEDAAQALGLDWVDDQAKFQDPSAPRDSHRPSAYRIAELLLGDNDAHAKNLAISIHAPRRPPGWRLAYVQ